MPHIIPALLKNWSCKVLLFSHEGTVPFESTICSKIKKYHPVLRVVAKKIISIEPVSVFCLQGTWKFSFPIFHNTLNTGLPSFAFTRWWKQYMEREYAKQVLKTRFYFNYFTCYCGTNAQGSQEFIPNFSSRWLDMVQISYGCTWVT